MRDFNLEEVKAGGKVCTRSGISVDILKWDARGIRPIIGIIHYEHDDCPTSWDELGLWDYGDFSALDLMMEE